jgi:hypothetical protein
MKKNVVTGKSLPFLSICLLICLANNLFAVSDTLRTMKYSSRVESAAIKWQNEVRSRLLGLLKLDDLVSLHTNNTLNPKELSSVDKGDYTLREVEINSTPGRRIRVVITFPKHTAGPWPAVICIHGHGGQSLSVYDKGSIYKGFADALATRNFVTIAGFVSQHKVVEEGRLLMGERLWDLIRCVDYLESLKEVDKTRIGCAGLSLGGEMAMWLGAADTRIHATVSAGFLTKMDQMEHNHCMCWKFPGLRQLVDYADIYSLIAPRPLQCQNGTREPVRDFYVPVARDAFKEIEVIYWDYQRPENLNFDVHNGAHEIDLPALISFFGKYLVPEGSL